jgi:hypothetical protein
VSRCRHGSRTSRALGIGFVAEETQPWWPGLCSRRRGSRRGGRVRGGSCCRHHESVRRATGGSWSFGELRRRTIRTHMIRYRRTAWLGRCGIPSNDPNRNGSARTLTR